MNAEEKATMNANDAVRLTPPTPRNSVSENAKSECCGTWHKGECLYLDTLECRIKLYKQRHGRYPKGWKPK